MKRHMVSGVISADLSIEPSYHRLFHPENYSYARIHIKWVDRRFRRTGHAIDAGQVKLVFADHKSQTAGASLLYEDQAFHLDKVPEGEFLPRVYDAKDVSRPQVENAPG